MKLVVLFFVLVIVLAVDGNPFSRKCECTAVSNTVHFPFHSWDISSCKLCSCKDPAVANCEQACKSMVENYARSGCGKVIKGSKVKYRWDAGSCSEGTSSVEYTCA